MKPPLLKTSRDIVWVPSQVSKNKPWVRSFYHFLATAVNSGESTNLLTVDYGRRQPCVSAPGSRKVSTLSTTAAEPATVDASYQTVHNYNYNKGFAASLTPAQAIDAIQGRLKVTFYVEHSGNESDS